MRQKRVRGFSTGDLIKAVVPAHLKTRGVHVGRVAMRLSGSFKVDKTDGINARYRRIVARCDGYVWQ